MSAFSRERLLIVVYNFFYLAMKTLTAKGLEKKEQRKQAD